jgi:chromosome segregation ATPase
MINYPETLLFCVWQEVMQQHLQRVQELKMTVQQLQDDVSVAQELATCRSQEVELCRKEISELEGQMAEKQRKIDAAAVEVTLVIIMGKQNFVS